MLALIARMRSLEDRTRAASAAAKDRFHKRGQLLPRERVALVLDPGSPFIELSTLAGYMFDVPDAEKSVPGGGLIAGIGFVSGIRCMVSANDSGIDAGALQPYGLDKTLRVQELAIRWLSRRGHCCEGSPNVLLEAMAAGIPVVATPVGGIPEIVTHGESALLVPPQNPGAMAEAINLLLSSPGTAISLAQQARANVETDYTPEARARSLLQIYAGLLHSS